MTIHRIVNTELFILHDRAPSGNDAFIIYAPLTGDIFLADETSGRSLLSDDFGEDVKGFIRGLSRPLPSFEPRDPGKSLKLSLIPNNICNFACSYCYSAAGRSNAVLNSDKLFNVLDWFIDPSRTGNNSISIFITGGGEPLATADLTRAAIARGRQLATARGVRLYISMITNGSLITEETVEFLREMECSVCVSFEVLEGLQEELRKSHEAVSKNIVLLLLHGVRTMISSTITPRSVNCMEEMTECVCRDYPGIAQFSMEPVTSADLFNTAGDLRSFYSDFRKNYYNSKKIAEKHGIRLRFTFDDALGAPTVRHCPGKLTLTPQGTFSVCHLVSSVKERRYADCIYGEVTTEGNVRFDRERFNKLYGRNLSAFPECRDCIAKWSCGGECMTRRATYPPEYMNEVCGFNRQIVIDQIMRAVNE